MGLSTVYLTNYKNYHNRKTKRERSLTGYESYIISAVTNVNFNTGDGVDTSLILPIDDDIEVSYIIICDELENIKSRWFIMDRDRTLTGQYRLTLHRDLIVDFYDRLIDAPMYIERGPLNRSDHMIFNDEGITVNEIKRKEIKITDLSRCAWLVGYFSRFGPSTAPDQNNPDPDPTISVLTGSVGNYTNADISVDGPLTSWSYNYYITHSYVMEPVEQEHIIHLFTRDGLRYTGMNFTINRQGVVSRHDTYTILGYEYDRFITSSEIEAVYGPPIQELNNLMRTEFSTDWNDDTASFLRLDGKVLQTVETDGVKQWRIKVIRESNLVQQKSVNNTSNYGLTMYQKLLEIPGRTMDEANHLPLPPEGDPFECRAVCPRYKLQLTDISQATTYTIPADRYHCKDAPYDIFAIPYGEINVTTDGGISFVNQPEMAMDIAYDINARYSGSNTVYDIQLLPYCPIPSLISSEKFMDLRGESTRLFQIVQDANQNPKCIILNITYGNFSNNFPIPEDIDYDYNADDPKVEDIIHKYRLVSPNYNGQFEFSAAKNKGIQRFDVDCSYKPYSPYIHVAPNFKGMYGIDFDDARGLVCGGDFSLSSVGDKWQDYQINNKNYLNTFNRQIESMDFHNKLTNQNHIIDAAMSTIKMGLGGNLAGGGVGAAVGAVSSIGQSAIGIVQERRAQAEAIDYKKDMFNMELGSVQALPYSLNRVTSLTKNNKLFPFLEMYSCSPQEMQAVRDKFKYTGYKVGRVGTLHEFLAYTKGTEAFFSANPIRMEIQDDQHLLNVIAEELKKGIFIGGDNDPAEEGE